MPHSSSTRSRWRARPVELAQLLHDRARGQDEVVPGDARLDAPGQALEARGVLGPGTRGDVGDGEVRARLPRRRAGPPRRPGRRPPGRGGRGAPRRPPRRSGEAVTVERREPDRPPLGRRRQVRVEEERHGPRPAPGPSRATRGGRPGRPPRPRRGRRPAPRSASEVERAGDEAGAAQPRLPNRSGRGRLASRRRARGGRGRRRPAAAPPARGPAPRPSPPRCRSARARRPGGRRREGRPRARPCPAASWATGTERRASTAGSGVASPRRWAATRSGTRSARVRNGRSASSTTSSPPATSGASGPSRARPGPEPSPAPGQLEGQADAGPAPRDVVVEVAVEPLEARVEVRSQGDEEELHVERLEVEGPGEPAEPQLGAGRLRGVGLAPPQRPGGRPRPRRRRNRASGAWPPASRWSTCASETYRPRKRSSGSGSPRAPAIHRDPDPVGDEAQPAGEVTGGGVGGGREDHRGQGRGVAAHPDDAARASPACRRRPSRPGRSAPPGGAARSGRPLAGGTWSPAPVAGPRRVPRRPCRAGRR